MADALLIVDVQHGLIEALPAARRDAFVATIHGLIFRARARGTGVVYVRHQEDEGLRAGTPDWEIAGDVRPLAGERIVEKRHADAFEGTDLDDVLRTASIDHLIVCGMQSEECIDATARGGARRDFRVTVVEDAHATYAAHGETEEQLRARINRGLREGGVGLVHAANAFS